MKEYEFEKQKVMAYDDDQKRRYHDDEKADEKVEQKMYAHN